MILRSVRALQYAEMVDMGGVPVRQPLPAGRIDMVDPFLLLHHHQGLIRPDSRPQESGVGPHPHRGFSPVTFIFKGDVHHRDSRGNSAIVKAGGVQWMDAGMGIIHSERPSKEFAASGGVQEIVQLWVNTPQRFKMEEPRYQSLQFEDIPQILLEQNGGNIQVVAGSFEGVAGPALTRSEMIFLRADLNPGVQHTFTIPEKNNIILYVLKGSLAIERYGPVSALHMVVFNNDGDTISVSTEQRVSFLLLAAEPLHEKVEKYGPFVMNSQTEIMQALRDYQMGKMGFLVEEFE